MLYSLLSGAIVAAVMMQSIHCMQWARLSKGSAAVMMLSVHCMQGARLSKKLFVAPGF